MKRHLIVGDGNLGWSLFRELEKRGDDCRFFCRGHLEENNMKKFLLLFDPDFIWWCAGGVTVGSKRSKITTNLWPATKLARKKREEATFVYFSSYYAQAPKLSYYAKYQKMMEDQMASIPGCVSLRVGTLAGAEYPERTIVEKIRKMYDSEARNLSDIWLPFTDTDVLAKRAADHLSDIKTSGELANIMTVVPEPIHLRDLAHMISPAYKGFQCAGFDKKRPYAPRDTHTGSFPTAKEMLEGYLKKIDG